MLTYLKHNSLIFPFTVWNLFSESMVVSKVFSSWYKFNHLIVFFSHLRLWLTFHPSDLCFLPQSFCGNSRNSYEMAVAICMLQICTCNQSHCSAFPEARFQSQKKCIKLQGSLPFVHMHYRVIWMFLVCLLCCLVGSIF